MQKNVCSKESCASITLYLCPVCSTFSWLKLHLKTWIWCFLPEPGDNHSIYNLNVICVVAWSCPGNRCEVGKFLWSTQVTSDELFSGWECSLIRSPDKVLGMSVVEWMGLFESVVGCVIWMTVVTWAVRCLRPCVVGSMSECVVMCVVGWVGAGWLWSWLTDGMTVCWLCSEVSEGCLRPCVVGSMSECVCVCGGMSGSWLTVVLTDWWDDCVLTVQWGVWGVSEAVCGWVHEWMCGYVCVGMSGSWLTVVLTDWWDDCVLTVQWVSEGCLRPCVVGSMSECVVMCVLGWVGAGWLWSWLTDGMTVCWLCSEVSEGCLRPCVVGSMSECVVMCVVGWVGAGWLWSWLTDGMTVCWLCSECLRGVWGRVWLGPWVNVWLCVCWDEWELADCGLDWLMGWLCVDCAVSVWGVSEAVCGWVHEWMCGYVCGGMSGSWLIVVLTDWWDDCVLTVQWVSEGCLRPCVVGSMSECVVMCVLGWVGAGWLWSWLTDGMTVCWLCSECLRGVWGCVWLGPWVNVWLCVWWDEWELADCGLDWLMGWLCVDCAVSVWGVSEAVCGWVHEWMCLCVWWELADCGLDWLMGWLCVDCAVRCPRGVWGSVWLGPWVNVWLDVVGWVGAVCLGQWVGVWLSVCIGGGWVRCLAKFLWSIQVTSEANFTNMV